MMYLASKNSKRQNSQCGATLVESALVFVVFISLALGLIDWGVIYTKRMLIRNAFYQAARVGAMQSTGCTAAAQNEFQRQLGRFAGFVTADSPTGHTTLIAAGATQIAGLELTDSVQISCITCPFLLGSSSPFTTYSLQSFYPYQSQTIGSSTTCAGTAPGIMP